MLYDILKSIVTCAFSLVVASAACAVDVVLRPDGSIQFGDKEFKPIVFLKGWISAHQAGGYEIATPGVAKFRFVHGGRRLADATAELLQRENGVVGIRYTFVAVDDFDGVTIGGAMTLDAKSASGQPWRTEDKNGTFLHFDSNAIRISSGKCRSFGMVPGVGGSPLRFSFANATDYLVQDNRKWSDTYVVRFGDFRSRRIAKGDVLRLDFDVKSSIPFEARDAKHCVIRAGTDWIPLSYHRDIIAGSALDFSQMGFTDAPAGKHGWIRNVGGHFEFERLPGRAQRFYGVNLCGTANFPDHALADILITRFKRLGYNTLRMHHHDGGMTQGSADGVSLNAENMERFDYFVDAAIRAGLYITTDLYVSRARNIKWRHIGVDADGMVDTQLFKALCAVHEPAFENWAQFARNFLTHVNPYTGRRYADESALPLVSLVNEGGFFMGWNRGVRNDPRILASWSTWLSAKREVDPLFAPGMSGDSLPESFWKDGVHPAIAQWTGCLEAKMVAKMRAFLRTLGCKALITNDNCGPHYAALQIATAEYDYIDDHFYVDHPTFLEKPWSLPSTCPNLNPLLGERSLSPCKQAFARMLDKPFTISEWNFSGPGRYRGVGGILTGAMAALQDWDGLWRFAYAHSSDKLRDADVRSPGYFDLASDPLAQASERACLCLFMRGDLLPFKKGIAIWNTPESAVSHTSSHAAAPDWSDVAWRMRVGSCLSPLIASELKVIRREEADGESPAGEEHQSLVLDRVRGAVVIDTPRTCGGFAPAGRIDVGLLCAKIEDAPATVWVNSLDGASIARSKRLLLTHITDVQGEGTKFTDDQMRTTLKWGHRPLVKNGKAKITLALDDPDAFAVYGIATNGKRTGKVESFSRDGRLCFIADVATPEGARILYEILRESKSARDG